MMRYAFLVTVLVLAAGCSNRPPKLVCIENITEQVWLPAAVGVGGIKVGSMRMVTRVRCVKSIINPEYTAWLRNELNEIEEKD